MLIHYIEYLYLYPGTIIHETISHEILERNLDAINIFNGCTAFRFFDKEVFSNSAQKQNISG